MSITLEYLKNHNEIYILIKVKIETLSTLLGKDLSNAETIYGFPCLTIVNIGYYVNRGQNFEVTYIRIDGDDEDTITLFETKVEEEIIEFLNKLNSIDYTIEDEEY
jgi:hypothetical protein